MEVFYADGGDHIHCIGVVLTVAKVSVQHSQEETRKFRPSDTAHTQQQKMTQSTHPTTLLAILLVGVGQQKMSFQAILTFLLFRRKNKVSHLPPWGSGFFVAGTAAAFGWFKRDSLH